MALIIDVQEMAALGESGFPATFPGRMGMSLERLERLELDSGLPLAHMVFTGQRAEGRWEDIRVVFRCPSVPVAQLRVAVNSCGRNQDEPGARRLSVTLRGGRVEAAMDRRRRGAQALARGSCALGRFTRQDASPGVPQDGSAREFTVLRRRRGAAGQAALTGAAILLLLRAGRGPGRPGEFQDIPGYECGGESGWTPQQRPAKGGGRRPSSRPPDPQRLQNAPTRRTGRPPLRRSAPTPGSAPPPRSNRGARPASTGAPKCRLDTWILIYREQKK